MARTPNQVSQDIRAKLAVTIPELSVEIGTPERKFVDTLSEAISEAYLDQAAHASMLDIDAKKGAELEGFVGIFGFGRLEGRRATGVVRMELSSPASAETIVQKGVQYMVPANSRTGDTPVYFVSTEMAVISAGMYSVDVPVQCTVVGAVGNVPPGAIMSVVSGIGGFSVNNLAPMSGGVNVETDEELRQRFKDTFMRNLSGTSDFYMALALAHKSVSKVKVFGPTEIYRTQVEAPTDSTILPVIDDVKFVWNASESVFRDLALPSEEFFSPGVDYFFAGGTNAVLARTPQSVMQPGDIVDVEFEYTSKVSRNEPVEGITNKIDIFVNGVDPYVIRERNFVSRTTFSPDSTSELFFENFYRSGTQIHPEETNRFTRLGSTPLSSFPTKITVARPGSNQVLTFFEGRDYYVVTSNQLLRGTEREVAGIEWTSTGPATGTELTLVYTYNRLPEVLNALVRGSKQITTDVLYHEARYLYLTIGLSVEYNYNVSVEQVNSSIQTSLRQFYSSFNFGDWIEVSDIVNVVHQVNGVDDVRLISQGEDSDKAGIRCYLSPASEEPDEVFHENFKLRDDQLPSFMEAVFIRRANK